MIRMTITCRCGNTFVAYVDVFGVYYCDVCEQYYQTDTED